MMVRQSDAACPDAACPVCQGGETFEFLRRHGVPVHQHLLFEDAASARGLARGNLAMRLCQGCGFAFNAAFRPDLLDYGPRYDNCQTGSEAYRNYGAGLVRELVEVHGIRGFRVLEIGCGKGAFLHGLVSYPGAGNTGRGFDPAYVGPETQLDGRLRFYRREFAGVSEPADVIVCRHVIEHIPQPLELLRAMRQAGTAGNAGLVFLETPCLEWILRHQVIWDFFYEHCALFTANSLALALQKTGFREIEVKHVFGGQYLWARAALTGKSASTTGSAGSIHLARRFAAGEPEQVRHWKALVRHWAAAGEVVVWGAGAKGVTFVNQVDPQGTLISSVIDVNRAKQGKFLPGTGHRIEAPEALRGRATAAALVLNPIYLAEIADQLRDLGSAAVVVDAMSASETGATTAVGRAA